MPRTMAVIGFTFFLSMWFFLETSQTAALVTTVVSAVGFAVSLIIKKSRNQAVFPAVFLTVIAASVIFNVQTNLVYKPTLALAGDGVSVTGEICELPYINTSGRYCYVLKTRAVSSVPYNAKILLSVDKELEAEPCDTVSFVGNVYVRGGEEAEIRENLMSGGVWLGAYTVNNITVESGKKSLNYYLLKVRQYTQQTVMSALPKKEASVLVALLLGNTSFMSDSVYNAFLRSGILHLFAVSGFNLSLFSMSILRFLKKRRLPRVLSAVLPIIIVLFIMAITGFSQSCVRAGIMILILIVGGMFSQHADALNSLGLASLIICMADPFQASSVGFHLSLFASGTVILVSPFITEKIVAKTDFKFKPVNAVMRYILSTFLISLCVCIALLPIMMLSFGRVSVTAPVVNCFTVFASEWELVIGFAAVVFSTFGFFEFLSKPLFLICGILSDYIVSTAEFFSDFKFAYLKTDYPEIRIWIAGMLVATALIVLMKTSVRRRVVYTVSVAAVSLIFTAALLNITEGDSVTVTALPTGNSLSAVVSYRDKTVFIGSVDSYDCMQDIKELTDGSADVMILPETKDDTYLSKLLTTFECGEIVIPKKTAETLSISYFTVPTVAKDYALSVSENLTVDFRYGEVGSVFYIKANGKRILMILKPGTDLSSVPEKWLNADILYSVSDVPKALECDKFGHVILLSDAQRGKKISDLIRADGADVTYTGDREVVLEINSEGLCKIQ